MAGLPYHDVGKAGSDLTAGSSLLLRREPDNPHDDLAIEILTLSGIKLGYVPRIRNPVIARLMDAGKTMVAQVALIHPEDMEPGMATKIRLRIAMKEF